MNSLLMRNMLSSSGLMMMYVVCLCISCFVGLKTIVAINTNVGYEHVLYNPGIYTNSKPMTNPITIPSSSGVLTADITVEPFRFTSDVFDFDTRAYCYVGACSLPGPTLIVQQGDLVNLRIVNKLGSRDNSKANTSTFFLHGLRIGTENAGLYSRAINHADYALLSFTIPKDHAPGVHWYHSASPGVEALHVAGGLHGAIIVNPSDSSVLPSALLAMRRTLVVFSHVDLRTSIAAPVLIVNPEDDVDSLPPMNVVSVENILEQAVDDLPSFAVTLPMLTKLTDSKLQLNVAVHTVSHKMSSLSPSVSSNVVPNAWLANGQYQPTISLVAEEWIILDLVAATGDRMLELEIASERIGHGSATDKCAMRILAIDGIYLPAPRGKPYSDHIPLLQGGRVTVVAMCTTAGTYYLQSASVVDDGSESLPAYVRIGKPSTKSIQNLITLVVSPPTAAPKTPPPSSLLSIPRPAYLSSLVNAPLTSSGSTWSLSVEQRGCCQDPIQFTQSTQVAYWLGVGKDCTLTCFDDRECAAFYGSNYSVFRSPTVQLQKCHYAPNRSPAPESDGLNIIRNSVVNRTEEIVIWSPRHYVENLQFVSQSVQIIGYSSMGHGGEEVHYGPFRGVNDQDYSLFYGEFGDWRDTLPVLVGRLTVRTNYSEAGIHIVRSSETITSSQGMWTEINVGIQANVPLPTNSPTPSPISVPTPNRTNTVDVGIIPEFKDVWVFDDSDYYKSLCQADGSSSRYFEHLDLDGGIRTIVTNSCPSHFSACQEERCSGDFVTLAKPFFRVYQVPLYPGFARQQLDTTCSYVHSEDDIGVVAVALNGVSIRAVNDGTTAICSQPKDSQRLNFGGITTCPYDGYDDGILYCGDSVQSPDAKAFDKCGGSPDVWGRYSYRVPPVCLIEQMRALSPKPTLFPVEIEGSSRPIVVEDNPSLRTLSYRVTDGSTGEIVTHTLVSMTTDAASSPQVAWALDGFPVYGPRGPLGILMRPCGSPNANPQVCLDECNGLAGEFEGFDSYLYRYFVSGEVGSGNCSDHVVGAGDCDRFDNKCCLSQIPSKSFWPYTIGCFKGCTFTGDKNSRSSILRTRAECVVVRPGVSDTFQPRLSVAVTKPVGELSSVLLPNLDAVENVSSNALPQVSPIAIAAKRAYLLQQKVRLEKMAAARKSDQASQFKLQPVQMLIRDAFNLNLKLVTLNNTIADSQVDSIAPNSNVATVQNLPDGRSPNVDDQIQSLEFDSTIKRLFYTTPAGLFSTNEDGSDTDHVLAGLMLVTIRGYNFGYEQSDLRAIRIKKISCVSVHLYNSTYVDCLSVKPGVSRPDQVSASSVYLETRWGSTTGAAPQPLTAYRQGTGRPVIASVTFHSLPFFLTTIALSPNIVPLRPPVPYYVPNNLDFYDDQQLYGGPAASRVVYIVNAATGALPVDWSREQPSQSEEYDTPRRVYTERSSNPEEGYHILRCRGDGSQVEVVVSRVQRCTGLDVIAANSSPNATSQAYSATEIVFFTDASNGTLGRAQVPILSSSVVYNQPAATFNRSESSSFLIDILLRGIIQPSAVQVDVSEQTLYVAQYDGSVFKIALPAAGQPLRGDRQIVTEGYTHSRLTSLCLFESISTSSFFPLYLRRDNDAVIENSLATVVDMLVAENATTELNRRDPSAAFRWNQQRIFATDANQQLVLATSSVGYTTNPLRLGANFAKKLVVFPTSCSVRSVDVNDNGVVVTMFVSELLGKIWKVTLPYDSSGRVISQNLPEPSILLDHSFYPTSVALRKLLEGNNIEGNNDEYVPSLLYQIIP